MMVVICDGVEVFVNIGLLWYCIVMLYWYLCECLCCCFIEMKWVDDCCYVMDGNVMMMIGVFVLIFVLLVLLSVLVGLIVVCDMVCGFGV